MRSIGVDLVPASITHWLFLLLGITCNRRTQPSACGCCCCGLAFYLPSSIAFVGRSGRLGRYRNVRAKNEHIESVLSGSEDACTEIAAHYLVPVLFGSTDGDTTKTIDAEKALKRCLRQCERIWRGGSNDNSMATDTEITKTSCLMASLPSSDQSERQISRKSLSDLILGTSVMRLRHWYVLNERKILDDVRMEPIVGVEPWMMSAASSTSNNNATGHSIDIARELVRLQAQYLLTPDNCFAYDNIEWPTNAIQRISVQKSLPSFIVRLFVDQYGEDVAEILSRLANRPGPITLRRNAIRCESDEELMRRLWDEDGIKSFAPNNSDASSMLPPNGCIRLEFDGGTSASERPSKSLWSLQTWKDGWFEVQDVGSQIIVDSMDIQRTDQMAVDVCAGNGGKTLALASRMWEKSQAGTVIAHDIVESRLKQIEGSLARAGLSDEQQHKHARGDNLPKIRTTCDATTISNKMADAVLVDAPCSSLGVLRRRPGHRWGLTEDMITQEYPSLQLDILLNASKFVKPGGKLVYATCSICRFENEDVIEMFESKEGFGEKWQAWEFKDFGSHCRSILPHENDSDGFFIARWKRRDR